MRERTPYKWETPLPLMIHSAHKVLCNELLFLYRPCRRKTWMRTPASHVRVKWETWPTSPTRLAENNGHYHPQSVTYEPVDVPHFGIARNGTIYQWLDPGRAGCYLAKADDLPIQKTIYIVQIGKREQSATEAQRASLNALLHKLDRLHRGLLVRIDDQWKGSLAKDTGDTDE
jgi:hypothetical protein